MPLSRLEYLFNLYIQHNYTGPEEQEFMALLGRRENEAEIKKLIDGLLKNTESEIHMPDQVAAYLLENILQKKKSEARSSDIKNLFSYPWMRIAAAVILMVTGTQYWFLIKKAKERRHSCSVHSVKSTEKLSQVLPGGNHAVLTMADGSKIILDSIRKDLVILGSARLVKGKAELVYDDSPAINRVPGSYNTLSTPRGGQYKVILADGSKVWLNSSSSLHYPTAFTGKQRNVELTGEAYFEVAKNKRRPFHVKVNGMQIEVLGTHFNVDAYSDEEKIKTSLLEGSVKISKGHTTCLLKPGQQGVFDRTDGKMAIKDANVSREVAWKNGFFQFDGADIITILKQIGRWYDVQVIFPGKVPERRFEGKISRDAQLSDVLKILELSNVKFNLTGKKIIVE